MRAGAARPPVYGRCVREHCDADSCIVSFRSALSGAGRCSSSAAVAARTRTQCATFPGGQRARERNCPPPRAHSAGREAPGSLRAPRPPRRAATPRRRRAATAWCGGSAIPTSSSSSTRRQRSSTRAASMVTTPNKAAAAAHSPWYATRHTRSSACEKSAPSPGSARGSSARRSRPTRATSAGSAVRRARALVRGEPRVASSSSSTEGLPDEREPNREPPPPPAAGGDARVSARSRSPSGKSTLGPHARARDAFDAARPVCRHACARAASAVGRRRRGFRSRAVVPVARHRQHRRGVSEVGDRWIAAANASVSRAVKPRETRPPARRTRPPSPAARRAWAVEEHVARQRAAPPARVRTGRQSPPASSVTRAARAHQGVEDVARRRRAPAPASSVAGDGRGHRHAAGTSTTSPRSRAP